MKKLTVVALALLLVSGCAATGGSRLEPVRSEPLAPAGPAGQKPETRALRDEVGLYLDLILGLLPSLSGTGSLIMDELHKVYSLVVSGGGGGCPSVAVDPPVFNGLPAYVYLTVSYGEGCAVADGSTLAGSWSLDLTNISQTATHAHIDYLFTASNLSRDGVVVADGAISGSWSLEPYGDGHKITVTLNIQGLRTMDWVTLQGGLTVDRIGLVADTVSFHTHVVTPADLTLAYDAPLLSGEYVLQSGSLTLVRQGDTGNFEVTADLVTSGGPVQGSALVESPAAGSYLVNTTGPPCSIGDYGVTAENLVLEPQACAYPLGGRVNVTKGSEEALVGFPGVCDGTYIFY